MARANVNPLHAAVEEGLDIILVGDDWQAFPSKGRAADHMERRTSGAPLVPLVMATLAHLTSVQARLTATSNGADAAAFGETVSAVRRDGRWRLDLVEGTRPVGAGDTTVAEHVVAGTTVCARNSFNAPRGPFLCRRSPRDAADITADLLPILNVLPPHAGGSSTYSYVRGGAAWVRGLLCDAYRYIVHSPTDSPVWTPPKNSACLI